MTPTEPVDVRDEKEAAARSAEREAEICRAAEAVHERDGEWFPEDAIGPDDLDHQVIVSIVLDASGVWERIEELERRALTAEQALSISQRHVEELELADDIAMTAYGRLRAEVERLREDVRAVLRIFTQDYMDAADRAVFERLKTFASSPSETEGSAE